ncbi:DUF2846 domain-containing protein [Xylophilus sp. Kf1]|nr:DUF2846 domain-containing protein [Xylophilus sp. Kf1]
MTVFRKDTQKSYAHEIQFSMMYSMKRLPLIKLLALTTLMTGCASAPRGPQFIQQMSAPEVATLYVFRLQTPPYQRVPDVLINRKVVAELPTNSYFKVALQPGQYEIKSDYGLMDNLILSKSIMIIAAAGKSYFVEFTGKPGLIGGVVLYGAGINATESDVAPAGIINCTRVEANVQNVQPQ